MIKFDAVDFSERRKSEERDKFLLTLSVLFFVYFDFSYRLLINIKTIYSFHFSVKDQSPVA